MREPRFYGSVSGIIRNLRGELLILQRGVKSSSFVGRYQIPGGHIDGKESVFKVLKREMNEELMIHIEEKDVELVYTSHRTFEDGKEYFDFYFEIKNFFGEPKIGEPQKCSDLKYVSLSQLELNKVLKTDVIAIDSIMKGISFAEINLKNEEY